MTFTTIDVLLLEFIAGADCIWPLVPAASANIWAYPWAASSLAPLFFASAAPAAAAACLFGHATGAGLFVAAAVERASRSEARIDWTWFLSAMADGLVEGSSDQLTSDKGWSRGGSGRK